MWELLTGEEPYSGMRAAEIIGNVQSSLYVQFYALICYDTFHHVLTLPFDIS